MFKNLMGNIKFEAIVPDTNNFINILKESYISIEGLQYQKGKIIGKIGKNDFK